MKTNISCIYSAFIALFALTLSITAQAAGLMTPINSALNSLEIQQHHVDVTIEDGYAITHVTQVFFNPNDTTLEALYSFPIPKKAAVGEFTYWIDGKPVTGEVLEKAKARQVYEQEKSQGRETALTEQDKYKSFDTNVYPVLPKQDVKIRLVYIQPVHSDHGIGSYVYPLEDGGVDEEKLAFWSYNDVVTEAFSFNLRLRSSYPVEEVRLPKHPQAIAQSSSSQQWEVSMQNGQHLTDQETIATQGSTLTKLDQDIVVYWRHQKGLPGSIDMVTHKAPGNHRGTFMMTITPGDDLKKINEGRDWVFVLDFSGSMKGKYQSLVEGVNRGLSQLNPKDRFRVILFNNHAREITGGYTLATQENVRKYTQELESTAPSGGTNLYQGLKEGIEDLDSDRSSAIILVTDGVANVGTTEKKSFLNLLEKYDVRLFTFVMGNSANRPLLDSMTKVSNGFAMSVSNSDDIVGKLMLATDKLTHEAYHDVEVDIDGIKVKDLTPARIGSIYRGRQLIQFGHYWGYGQANVTVKAKISGEKKEYRTAFSFPDQSELNPEIERLWAYATIEDLQNQIDYLGEDPDSKQAIVDLAKEYGLVTDYTSMIVVREEVFKQLNIPRTNQKRVAKEQRAKEQRATQIVRDHQQDKQQPAFSTPRAYPSSGGGASDLWFVLTLLSTLLVARKTKRA